MVSRRIDAAGFAIVNATLVTMAPLADRAADFARVSEHDLGIIEHATVAAESGRIVFAGKPDGRRANEFARLQTIDAGGRVVMPGLIDAHTHGLFAGNRIADFESIAAGTKPKLGIRYTVEQTRHCSFAQLEELGARHLSWMASHGTTTAEVKTGYDLTAEGEARLLEVLASIDGRADLPHVIATFCGAHALPPEFDNHDKFIDELCDRVLPKVAELKIARFADAFCESGYFTIAQSRRFLEACAARGMGLRLHADELSRSGGARLAAEVGCASADHLNYAEQSDAKALADAGVFAVLCPATAEYLDLPQRPPARALIDGGVTVALATDFNPGTSPCFSLQAVAYLARRRLGMTLPEVLAGVTIQAARSLRIDREAGSIQPGKRADLAMLAIRDSREFGYYFGVNMVDLVAIGKTAK